MSEFNGLQHLADYATSSNGQTKNNEVEPTSIRDVANAAYIQALMTNGQRFRRLRTRENLPDATTKGLKQWLKEHLHNPYPNDLEKKNLARKYNMSLTQINNWFINARRRYLKEMESDFMRQFYSNNGQQPSTTPAFNFLPLTPDSLPPSHSTHLIRISHTEPVSPAQSPTGSFISANDTSETVVRKISIEYLLNK
jgi:hypothetical protein